MVYFEFTMEVARGKVQEALQYLQDELWLWNKENTEKAGGKIIGVWYTEYGRTGEIVEIVAYPSLDAREKFLQAREAEGAQRLAKWHDYTPTVTTRILRPAAFSPLQ